MKKEQKQIMANSSDKATVWNLNLVLVRKLGVDKRDPEELHTVYAEGCGVFLCVCVSLSVCVHNFVTQLLKVAKVPLVTNQKEKSD